jgi:hypothetical protein
MRRPGLATTLLTLTLLTACSEPRDPKALRSSAGNLLVNQIDACKLLISTEARAAVDHDIVPMSSLLTDEMGRDPGKCTFGTPMGEVPFGMVSLEIRRYEDLEEASRMQAAAFRTLKPMVRSDIAEESGVGDAAFWAGGEIRQLHLLEGTHRLILTVQVGDPAKQKAAALKLAAQALERMRLGLAGVDPPPSNK